MSYSFEAVTNISQDMWYLGFSQQFLEDEKLLCKLEVINFSEKHSASIFRVQGPWTLATIIS
jgi:hypothetical protein